MVLEEKCVCIKIPVVQILLAGECIWKPFRLELRIRIRGCKDDNSASVSESAEFAFVPSLVNIIN